MLGTALLLFFAFLPHPYDAERYWIAWVGDRVLRGTNPGIVGAESPYDAGRTWMVAEWLYAAAVAWFRDAAIYPVFAALNALAAASLLWCALGTCITRRVPRELSFFILLATATMLVARFQLRPENASVLFAVLTLAWSTSPRMRWALPPLFLLWANVHPSFFLGFLILAIAATQDSRRRNWSGWIVFALCALATLATPSGSSLWFAIVGMSGWSIRNVSEWQSTFVAAPGLMLLFLLPAVALTFGAKIRKRPHLDWILWPASALAALSALRFLPLALGFGLPAGAGLFRQRDFPVKVASVWLGSLLLLAFSALQFGPDVAAAARAPVRDADFGLVLARTDPIEIAAQYPVRGVLTYCYPVRFCNVVLLHGGRTLLDGRTLPFPVTRMPAFDASVRDFSVMRAWPFTLAMVAPANDPLRADPGWQPAEISPQLRIYVRMPKKP